MSYKHYLKLRPEFIDPIKSGRKTFEIRENDRAFQSGDTIVFCNTDILGDLEPIPSLPPYEITYILSGWGIIPDCVVFSIKPIEVM